MVNLVNNKGHELPIKEAFERAMSSVATDQKLSSLAHYVYFDFHTECKGMRFDRVSILIDRIAGPLNEMGWFHSLVPSASSYGGTGKDETVKRKQGGAVRSNCMDSCDRTNVTQSALGRWALDQQLRSVGVLSIKERLDDHADFVSIFRTGNYLLKYPPISAYSTVWANHGDTISSAYAGTGALKSDYTRTGKRTKEGALQDGYKSVMRYVKNNFFDGDRQVSPPIPAYSKLTFKDAFDVLTGGWVAKRGAIPPLTDTRPLLMRSVCLELLYLPEKQTDVQMPYVLAFSMTMMTAAITLPRTSGLSPRSPHTSTLDAQNFQSTRSSSSGSSSLSSRPHTFGAT